MAILKEVQYASIDQLQLDPRNPRLGKNTTSKNLSQAKLLEEMSDFTLDELAFSFIENSGFWTQEALIVVEEKLYSENNEKVVVEGNRRLAALKYLYNAVNQVEPNLRKINNIIEGKTIPEELFTKIPFLLAEKREDIDAFLGFRHVTGIKEWDPKEKAEFISKMIDSGMSYDQVRKKIGSKTPTVRNHYFAYKILNQIENDVEDFYTENINNRFSVLYLAIQKPGVQSYLNLDLNEQLTPTNQPIKADKLIQLSHFSKWLFGDEKTPPLFSDSRDTTKFAEMLQNRDALEYLESSSEPKWDQAIIIAGVDVQELVDLIRNSSWNVKYVLSRAHHYKNEERLNKITAELLQDVTQLSSTLNS